MDGDPERRRALAEHIIHGTLALVLADAEDNVRSHSQRDPAFQTRAGGHVVLGGLFEEPVRKLESHDGPA
jgi:hypothetical protein